MFFTIILRFIEVYIISLDPPHPPLIQPKRTWEPQTMEPQPMGGQFMGPEPREPKPMGP